MDSNQRKRKFLFLRLVLQNKRQGKTLSSGFPSGTGLNLPVNTGLNLLVNGKLKPSKSVKKTTNKGKGLVAKNTASSEHEI